MFENPFDPETIKLPKAVSPVNGAVAKLVAESPPVMKELFDDLKIVTGDRVLHLPTKGMISTERAITIEVESMVPENDPLSDYFKMWTGFLNVTGKVESDKHFSQMYIHHPAVYKHRKLVKRPGAGQRRATVFCIKSKTRLLKNVTPSGLPAVQLIDAPKLMDVTLELHFEGEEVKDGPIQAG